jgi:hypothetical protein
VFGYSGLQIARRVGGGMVEAWIARKRIAVVFTGDK